MRREVTDEEAAVMDALLIVGTAAVGVAALAAGMRTWLVDGLPWLAAFWMLAVIIALGGTAVSIVPRLSAVEQDQAFDLAVLIAVLAVSWMMWQPAGGKRP